MTTRKNIYNLNLHESTYDANGLDILRVPGGWLYGVWDSKKDIIKNRVFVPFNNEFQESEAAREVTEKLSKKNTSQKSDTYICHVCSRANSRPKETTDIGSCVNCNTTLKHEWQLSL